MYKQITPIKLVIADNHEIFRIGVKAILKKCISAKIHVVAEADNGLELIQAVEKYKPQVVITDIKMPKMDGGRATKLIKEKYFDIGVIVLTSLNEEQVIDELFNIGINGYLLKDTDKEEMIEAVLTASKGEVYYSGISSKRFLKNQAPKLYNRFFKNNINFNEKETRIIKLICKQFATKEIADELGLQIRTVEDYIKHIKEKTNATKLVGIALYAVKNDIINIREV